jgi:hypothetical protein
MRFNMTDTLLNGLVEESTGLARICSTSAGVRRCFEPELPEDRREAEGVFGRIAKPRKRLTAAEVLVRLGTIRANERCVPHTMRESDAGS